MLAAAQLTLAQSVVIEPSEGVVTPRGTRFRPHAEPRDAGAGFGIAARARSSRRPTGPLGDAPARGTPRERSARPPMGPLADAPAWAAARAHRRPVRVLRDPGSYNPTGRLALVPGTTHVHGSGPLWRFEVQTERGLGVDAVAFGRHVEEILFARRGWTRGGGVAFQRVSGGLVDFRVILASPSLTDRLCAPALTRGLFSCHNHGRVVINFRRWTHGAPSYRGDLAGYRIYVVNHEVGHALGRGHLPCPRGGSRAPVMMQQTLGVVGCTPNPWPLAYERA